MARFAGREGRVYVSSDGGTSYSLVGCVVDMSLSGSQEELDSTCHESGQFRDYIAGRKEATLDLDMHYDEADAGQEILTNAYFSGTTIKVRFRMREATGARQFESDAIVTSYEPDSPNDDVAGLTATLRLKDDFTPSAQP